jgi:RimJ/RimL family protein N-acetyltransferase
VTDDHIIRTEHLLLRPLREGDAPSLHAHLANWEVIRWLGTPPWPFELADAERFVALQRCHPPVPTGFLAITLDDAVIGGVSAGNAIATDEGMAPRTPDLGYWLGQPYWGRGFMTEAVGAYLRRIFARVAVNTIYSGAFVGNHASLRVLEKLSFRRMRESLMYCRPQRAKLPHIDAELTRSRFLAEFPPQALAGCP